MSHAVGHGDGIGIGLSPNEDEDRTLAIVLRVGLIILDRVDDISDVLQPHRGSVPPSDHDRLEVGGGWLGGFRFEDVDLPARADRAKRADAGQSADGGTEFFDGDAAGSQGVEIVADAYGALLGAADVHLPDALQRRQARQHDGFGKIVDVAGRRRVRCQRENDDRAVGRVDLAEAWWRRQFLGQASRRDRDGRLHVECGGIDVAIEGELERNVRTAFDAG